MAHITDKEIEPYTGSTDKSNIVVMTKEQLLEIYPKGQ